MADKPAPKPYVPGRGAVKIHVDLEDMAKKAAEFGPWRVLGETIYNLCLMANDALSPRGFPKAGSPEAQSNGEKEKKT